MSSFSSETIGSYRVVEVLGDVPGGEACRAEDQRTGSRVLLKAIRRRGDGDPDLEAGIAEVRRLSRLDRPGIPPIYEVSETPEGLLIAFAPAPGETLSQFIAGGGRVDRDKLVDWLCQLLGLLAEVHSQDVLHRHLGPEAVSIGDGGLLSLSGFSLTQLAPDGSELVPPEVRGGGAWTPAGDLYALGALFERLAAPAAVGGGARFPLDPGDPLLAVLARAAAPDPEDRFADAADFEAAIREAVSGREGSEEEATDGAAGGEPEVEAATLPGVAAPAPPTGEAESPAVPEAAFSTQFIRADMLPIEARQPPPPGAASATPAPEPPAAPEPAMAVPRVEPEAAGGRQAAAAAATGGGPGDAAGSAAEQAVGTAAPPPTAPPAEAHAPAPAPPRRRSRAPLLLTLAAVLALLLVGAWWAVREGMLELPDAITGAGRAAPSAPPASPAGTGVPAATPGAPPSGPRASGAGAAPAAASGAASGAAAGTSAEALQLAREVVASGSATLFGAVELSPDQQALVADVTADVDAMGFADDPRGEEPAHSLFGENPLLSAANPLLSRKLRERWLAVAIDHMGSEAALAHLTEQAERLDRGEVTLAGWYDHVAHCKDFCNKVVSGLLYEHVEQVRSHPHAMVLFGRDGAALDAARREPLARFLAAEPPDSQLLLIGRASRSGNRQYNRELSQQRVAAVSDELRSRGIAGERIHGFWLGYEPPQLDRRIADLYGIDSTLSAEQLNQSVLVVSYLPPPAGG
jgi:serine/threonine protein kinase/outer membrane protein OmpA-like peptidoglycan-associated protein